MRKTSKIQQVKDLLNAPKAKGVDEIWVNETPFSSRKNGTNKSSRIIVTSINCAENLIKLMEG